MTHANTATQDATKTLVPSASPTMTVIHTASVTSFATASRSVP
eukprot:CAMPEP_0174866352 /NCGR_PEP_ID=MMETSP1114-20130205/61926_1 /TAXON_ID=312471 /ORGANISM="Neobodo designis, Strain CCAP 1951/1" /LENGTH=42 /DNA_ID= /DNA_START= /DNA_END= /DNA_ORIENTATION=